MKNFLLGILVASLVLGGLFWWHSAKSPAGHQVIERISVKYHCPMHTWYISDKPGKCPICGMDLVPIDAGQAAPAEPGSHAGNATMAEMPENLPSGYARVKLPAEKLQLMGVTTDEVKEMVLRQDIRTVGRVVPDETRVHHVHTKFEGYIESIYADFVGQFVKRGQPLFSVYSPDLLATQQEYLLALRAQRQLGHSQIPSVAQGGANLLEAARERLRLWDIREADIAELERTGTVRRTLNLYSDVTGYVIQKNVVQGMRVMPTDTLFDLADLSRVWVMADVYEGDLPTMRLGMPADVTLSYLPGKTWRGSVTNIAPTVEEKTRTIKVRVEVDNRDGALKPDMFADVRLRTDMGTGLVVPDSAIIDTGDRKLVFLDRPDGAIEPREVEVGMRIPEGYHVLRGLEQGDRVVTAANFLLDSESSLKSALAAFTAPSAPAPTKR